MEKVKLKNGTLFDIVPMGISQSDKIRTIKFISSLPYVEIEALFDSTNNVSNIQYLSELDEVLATYLDCVILKSLSKAKNVVIDDSLTADIYTVELSIDAVDILRAQLAENKERTDATFSAVDFIFSNLLF